MTEYAVKVPEGRRLTFTYQFENSAYVISGVVYDSEKDETYVVCHPVWDPDTTLYDQASFTLRSLASGKIRWVED